MTEATKQCSRCGKVKPLAEFPRNGKGTRRPECRECSVVRRGGSGVQMRNAAEIARGVRTCTRCKQTKPLSEFYIRRDRNTYMARCRDCMAEAGTAWRKDNPEKFRASNKRRHLMRKHGLTPESFAALLAAQGGGCAVCSSADPGRRGWAVDHDHSCCAGTRACGRCVRGILCNRCNMGIGLFLDDPARLRRAAEYLEQRGEVRHDHSQDSGAALRAASGPAARDSIEHRGFVA